jgi:hypothetical protein
MRRFSPLIVSLLMAGAALAAAPVPPASRAGTPAASAPVTRTPSADALALPEITELPDPFKFQDGTSMKAKADWTKRREELSQLIQKYQYGPYPAKPDKVTGTLNGNVLNVKVDYKGKSISYNLTITLPQGEGPFPAMFTISALMPGINAQNLNPRGVATIVFQPNDMASDAKARPRDGKFFSLYGADCKTGALMAWAWGIHRAIDALEATPAAKIDTRRLGVAGYSRYGKAALVTGAFDERITLTVPGGSGAGGVTNWRGADLATARVQTLTQVNGEAPHWFTDDFGANFIGRTKNLPFDAHEIIALCAPRAIIVQEGTQDTWNNNADAGPFQSAWAARKVFDYLEVPDNIGFVMDPHGHGAMTARESAAVLAFVDRFLLEKKEVATKYFDDNPRKPEFSWKAPEAK